MKKSKRWIALTAALTLTGLLAVGGAVAANGDRNDPLVTLSYLEKTIIPDVVNQVEDNMIVRQKEMTQNFDEKLGTYKKEMESSINGGAADSAFALVTMKKGQTLSLELGCELMLRVGTAEVKSPDNPALVDMTNAETVRNGASLEKNHLYMATIPDRVVNATAGTVKLLVRGGYTVK